MNYKKEINGAEHFEISVTGNLALRCKKKRGGGQFLAGNKT